MEFVFNDLSANHTLITDQATIRELISSWVRLLKPGIKEKWTLYVENGFYTFSVNGYYGIQDWLKDQYVSRETKQLFYSFRNRCLHTVDFQEYTAEKIGFLFEEQCLPAPCGSASYELEVPLLSLETATSWAKDHIDCLKTKDNIELKLDNVSCDSHLTALASRAVEKQFSSITSGQDLWEQREILFPNLVFCQSVKDQLEEAPHRSHIQRIIEELKKLNHYYDYYPVYQTKNISNASTESDTVKKDPNLKKFRLFTKPDGTQAYFYEHLKFTGDYPVRIHYLPEKMKKVFFIGYIGKHLPTNKYD